MADRAIQVIVNALNAALTTELVVEVHAINTRAPEGAANLDALAAAIKTEIAGLEDNDLPHRSTTTDGGLQVTWLARQRTAGEATERAVAG